MYGQLAASYTRGFLTCLVWRETFQCCFQERYISGSLYTPACMIEHSQWLRCATPHELPMSVIVFSEQLSQSKPWCPWKKNTHAQESSLYSLGYLLGFRERWFGERGYNWVWGGGQCKFVSIYQDTASYYYSWPWAKGQWPHHFY
jgi:hypothetical protein